MKRGDLRLNFARQELLGLRVMAWRMVSRLEAQIERLLKYLYENIINLHVVSLHLLQGIKMSVVSKLMVISISMWIRAKRPMGRSVSLDLCPRTSLRMWKRTRKLLPATPIPTSKKMVFLTLVLRDSLLILFILCLKEAGRNCAGSTARRFHMAKPGLLINCSQ